MAAERLLSPQGAPMCDVLMHAMQGELDHKNRFEFMPWSPGANRREGIDQMEDSLAKLSAAPMNFHLPLEIQVA